MGTEIRIPAPPPAAGDPENREVWAGVLSRARVSIRPESRAQRTTKLSPPTWNCPGSIRNGVTWEYQRPSPSMARMLAARNIAPGS